MRIAANATHQPYWAQNEGDNWARGGRREGIGSSAANKPIGVEASHSSVSPSLALTR